MLYRGHDWLYWRHDWLYWRQGRQQSRKLLYRYRVVHPVETKSSHQLLPWCWCCLVFIAYQDYKAFSTMLTTGRSPKTKTMRMRGRPKKRVRNQPTNEVGQFTFSNPDQEFGVARPPLGGNCESSEVVMVEDVVLSDDEEESVVAGLQDSQFKQHSAEPLFPTQFPNDPMQRDAPSTTGHSTSDNRPDNSSAGEFARGRGHNSTSGSPITVRDVPLNAIGVTVVTGREAPELESGQFLGTNCCDNCHRLSSVAPIPCHSVTLAAGRIPKGRLKCKFSNLKWRDLPAPKKSHDEALLQLCQQCKAYLCSEISRGSKMDVVWPAMVWRWLSSPQLIAEPMGTNCGR
jgi:hypothetical protein